MKRIPIPIAAILLAGLSGCDATTSHVPHPLLWPGAALSSGISNSIYDARRQRVSDFVSQNYTGLLVQIPTGVSPLLEQAMDIARVTGQNRPALLAELAANPEIYSGNNPEPMIVAIMVHGN